MGAQAKGLSSYWKAHFSDRHPHRADEGPARSLDYSNDRVQLQTYAAVLEGAGTLRNKTVWDAGCGWGELSLLLRGAGANVVGTDIVPATIARLQSDHPEIAWKVVDLMDYRSVEQFPQFDCVVACEVLQHIDHDTLGSLWRHTRPSGRLVGSVANGDCPIISEVIGRFGKESGLYRPITERELRHFGDRLPNVQAVWLKGLTFREDQSFQPYSASDWNKSLAGVPNRIIFTFIRGDRP